MENEIGSIAAIIGNPIRSKILWILLDGKAYTASELAAYTDTTPPNISMHLSKLVKADLLVAENHGRHKYYRFSRQEVAYAIEALGNLIPGQQHTRITRDKGNAIIKHCRTCYDHLAGKVGVLITEALVEQQLVELNGSSYSVTPKGRDFFASLSIDIEDLQKHRRAFARPCLDWSERKYHIAGSLGAALLNKMIDMDWLRKTKNSRAMVITPKGQHHLYDLLKVSV